MKKEIYILAIVLLCGLFLAGEGGIFDFNNKVFAAGATMVQATIKITVCGNGIIETGEQCDPLGSVLGGQTCQGLGFTGGTLSCQPSCEFNVSACTSATSCGNGSCGGSETCSSCPADCGTCSSGGGGGGGGYVAPPVVTQVNFSGRAYPLSKVVVLKDGQIAVSTIAGPDSHFDVSFAGLATGNYIFAIYGEDSNGVRSSLFTFSVYITSGTTTKISGIFIAPTIAVDKSEVKRGDNIAIFGQSAQSTEITIMVNSDEEYFVKILADKNGVYLHNFDTSLLEIGQHLAKSKAALGGEISSFSKAVGFAVGTKNISIGQPAKCSKADLNCDTKVNLVDFSIAAYWYKRPISASFASIEKERLNGDGKIDLVDFSIMAYYWTG
jgi:hypothetical protein